MTRCRRSSQKAPLDSLEDFVRSVRHEEDRIRADLRAAEREVEIEKEYSARVKREREDLRLEVKEVEEEKMRLKEQVKELSTEVNTLKTQAQRYVETEKKVTADLQRQVEKHLRTMMLALNESFRASGLVFDPEVQMPGFTHTSQPYPYWQYYKKCAGIIPKSSHRWACR